jgi:hypothetical protein
MERLLVLANSYKDKVRCLAGLNAAGEVVRVVSDAGGGGLPPGLLQRGSEQVEVGDLLDVDLVQSVPLDYQAENVRIGLGGVAHVGRESSGEVIRLLRGLAEDPPAFASSPRSRVDPSEYVGGLSPESLAVLRTDELVIKWQLNWNGVVRPRAIFMSPQGRWDLSYTGEQWDELLPREDGRRVSCGPAFITVSVGNFWNGSHFVLAAGVYLEK